MPDEKPPPKPKPLPRPKEEKFAQLMASGEFAAWQAYHEIWPEYEQSTARTKGPEMFRRSHIKARVAELQGMTADATVMTLKEWQEWHTMAVRTPIGEIDETHPLAQEMTFETKGGARGRLKRGQAEEGNEEASDPIQVVKIKSVCKQQSAAQLAKHFGWTKEEVKHSGSVGVEGLGELLGSITRPGLPHRAEEKPAEPAA